MQAKKEKGRIKAQSQPATQDNKEQSLRGAFASVMLLGGFLIITWLGVLLLFLARN
ncbi:cytochrome c oxidase subunit 2A [Paenibacillus thermotolerans]|uniref:cytochrome c oxidase subunit 2A n=1 Tax=Paenibacillus thermotolerans TaxID=3027807 RepID=UPI002367D5BA|nr:MULTISPECIES: cytochrome c oxidase subunit 2A [unclassified Paenibacillus]